MSDLSWDSVLSVSIDGQNLRVLTDHGLFTFNYPNTEKLSEALLILALQASRKIEFLDDPRFNPARFDFR